MEPRPPSAAAEILERARADGRARALAFAGEIAPADAWALASAGDAVIVDVRSAEELKFVGRIPGALHVPWATGLSLERNPSFVEQLRERVGPERVVMFMCRSARRSASAATAATAAGWRDAYNILEGVEGGIDVRRQRGKLNGWRLHDLPWEQD